MHPDRPAQPDLADSTTTGPPSSSSTTARLENKNVKLAPLPFLAKQILNLQPATALVWGAGLIWLLRSPQAKPWRWLGLTYLVFLAIMIGAARQGLLRSPHLSRYSSQPEASHGSSGSQSANGSVKTASSPSPSSKACCILIGAITLPLAIPILSPPTWIVYTKALHLYNASDNNENQVSGPLPQFYADRFGWQEEVDEVTRIYHSLSPEDQAKVGIFAIELRRSQRDQLPQATASPPPSAATTTTGSGDPMATPARS